MTTTTTTSRSLDSRARAAARKAGYTARKSRRALSADNRGGYLLADDRNHVVAGSRFELSAQDVLAWCKASPL